MFQLNSLSYQFSLRITGTASILSGLLYMYGFEVIEAEVRGWGMYAVLGGLLLLASSFISIKNLLLRAFVLIGLAILLLAQILPILLWLTLTPLSDSQEGDIGNRLYILPHAIVFILSLITIVKILTAKETTSSKNKTTRKIHNLPIAIAIACLSLFTLWQIGGVFISSPQQTLPNPQSISIHKNPIFIYEFNRGNKLFSSCTGGAFLENKKGQYIQGVSIGSEDLFIIYPENKLNPGDVVRSGFQYSCSVGLLFIADELGIPMFQKTVLKKNYTVNDKEYTEDELQRILEQYTPVAKSIHGIEKTRSRK